MQLIIMKSNSFSSQELVIFWARIQEWKIKKGMKRWSKAGVKRNIKIDFNI